ncbi:hypothetical protein GF376_04555 [Candidatus Peregrinibacteria bacterium]|nr:hypothetical protein [Candidatus Peregrinibacteria bacterium]
MSKKKNLKKKKNAKKTSVNKAKVHNKQNKNEQKVKSDSKKEQNLDVVKEKKTKIADENISPSKQEPSKKKRYSKKILTRTQVFLKIIKWISILILVILVLIAGVAAYIWFMYGQDLPDVQELKTKTFAETTTIYDREGNILYKIYGEENRKYVPLNEINQNVIDATIAIEDENFYYHFGFDPVAIMRAQLRNLEEEDIVQGASTITQQLAKNLYLTPEKTIDRKIKELLLSLQIEWYFNKDAILELYFNKIPYGSNAFGIEAASKTFFGKTSSQLSLVEASILASLPKAPSYFSPYGSRVNELMGECLVEFCDNPYDDNYVWGRKDIVLEKMMADRKISYEQFESAWRDGFEVEFKELKHEINSPHFVFFVRDYLERKYGKEVVESGGLEVKTTLDPNLQKLAEETIAEYAGNGHLASYGANNAALVSLEPSTGGVLAMVGSVNYWLPDIDGQVNVTTSLRQPGSSFKPFIYAAAIKEKGIGSGTHLGDYKTRFDGDYIPNNSDNTFKGRMTVRSALAQSRNIPAIKAFYLVGEEAALKFLESVGIQSLTDFKNIFNANPERTWDFSYGGAMAIGSGELKLVELASGYATFANAGKHMPINPILEIRTSDGEILDSFQDQGEQVMDPQVAYIINSILSDVGARPAGTWRNRLTIPNHNVAAKTGTSNKKIGRINLPNNVLTAGYTPSIATVVWAGNSDGAHMNYRAWGLTTAAPIWRSFMEKALEGKSAQEFTKPDGIIEKWGHVYPSWWDGKDNFDYQFKPLVKFDCTDEERAKDPIGCKSKEEMEAEAEESRQQHQQNFQTIDGVNPRYESGAEKPLSTIKKELEEKKRAESADANSDSGSDSVSSQVDNQEPEITPEGELPPPSF